jgi:hypothetical protein
MNLRAAFDALTELQLFTASRPDAQADNKDIKQPNLIRSKKRPIFRYYAR